MILRTTLTVFTACVLGLGFFIWTFPYQALEKRLEYEMTRSTGRAAEIDNLEYAFPLGLRCASTRIAMPPGSPVSELTLDRPALSLKPAGLISRQIRTDFSFGLWDGRVTGRANFFPLLGVSAYELACRGHDLQIDNLRFEDMLRTVQSAEGLVSYNMRLSGQLQNSHPAQGSGEIHYADGAMRFALPGDSLPFTGVQGQGAWEFSNQEVRIQECRVKAKGADADLSGGIHLRPSLAGSHLDLTGQIQLSGANPKAYSLARKYLSGSQIGFALTGSLRDPRYSLQ